MANELWCKLPVDITERAAYVGLSGDAWSLWLHAWAYCGRNLTDGVVPAALVRRLANIADPDATAAELEAAGLWARNDTGDWIVVDYLETNRSAADVDAARTAQAEAGRLGNHRRHHTAKGVIDPDCKHCTAEAGTQASGTRQSPVSGTRDKTRGRPDPDSARVSLADTDTDTDTESVSQSATSTEREPTAEPDRPTDVTEVIDNAAAELGRRDHLAALTAGVKIRNKSRHLHQCIDTRVDAVAAIASRHPDWTSDELITALDPPPPRQPVTRLPDLAPPDPVDTPDPATHADLVAIARAARVAARAGNTAVA